MIHFLGRYPYENSFFFLNDPPTTEFYPLPLHDALPIGSACLPSRPCAGCCARAAPHGRERAAAAAASAGTRAVDDRRHSPSARPAREERNGKRQRQIGRAHV